MQNKPKEQETETFLTMVRFTPEGRSRIAEWPGIYDGIEKQLDQVGGKLVDAYGVLGEYDFAVITECPNHGAQAQVWLALEGSGLIETHTHGLVPVTEFNRYVRETRTTTPAHAGR